MEVRVADELIERMPQQPKQLALAITRELANRELTKHRFWTSVGPLNDTPLDPIRTRTMSGLEVNVGVRERSGGIFIEVKEKMKDDETREMVLALLRLRQPRSTQPDWNTERFQRRMAATRGAARMEGARREVAVGEFYAKRMGMREFLELESLPIESLPMPSSKEAERSERSMIPERSERSMIPERSERSMIPEHNVRSERSMIPEHLVRSERSERSMAPEREQERRARQERDKEMDLVVLRPCSKVAAKLTPAYRTGYGTPSRVAPTPPVSGQPGQTRGRQLADGRPGYGTPSWVAPTPPVSGQPGQTRGRPLADDQAGVHDGQAGAHDDQAGVRKRWQYFDSMEDDASRQDDAHDDQAGVRKRWQHFDSMEDDVSKRCRLTQKMKETFDVSELESQGPDEWKSDEERVAEDEPQDVVVKQEPLEEAAQTLVEQSEAVLQLKMSVSQVGMGYYLLQDALKVSIRDWCPKLLSGDCLDRLMVSTELPAETSMTAFQEQRREALAVAVLYPEIMMLGRYSPKKNMFYCDACQKGLDVWHCGGDKHQSQMRATLAPIDLAMCTIGIAFWLAGEDLAEPRMAELLQLATVPFTGRHRWPFTKKYQELFQIEIEQQRKSFNEWEKKKPVKKFE